MCPWLGTRQLAKAAGMEQLWTQARRIGRKTLPEYGKRVAQPGSGTAIHKPAVCRNVRHSQLAWEAGDLEGRFSSRRLTMLLAPMS